jgi:hypothetical protein
LKARVAFGTALKARVAFGAPDQETLKPPANELERRYTLRAVKRFGGWRRVRIAPF